MFDVSVYSVLCTHKTTAQEKAMALKIFVDIEWEGAEGKVWCGFLSLK